MIDSTEKTLSEHRDKIGADDAKKVEEALAAAKEAVKSGDSAATERALENLTQAGHKLAEAMYQSPGSASGGASGAPGGADPGAAGANGAAGAADGDDVVDAEFVDADDKSKS